MELRLETRNPGTFTKPWGQTSPQPWLTFRGLFCAAYEEPTSSQLLLTPCNSWVVDTTVIISSSKLHERKASARILREIRNGLFWSKWKWSYQIKKLFYSVQRKHWNVNSSFLRSKNGKPWCARSLWHHPQALTMPCCHSWACAMGQNYWCGGKAG